MPVEHIEFLLEEPSAEEVLKNVVPKILGPAVTFRTHVFQGKKDLLNNLKKRLSGYRHWLPNNWGIVVLVDQDREDCKRLKEHMENATGQARLISKSSATSSQQYHVVNRIAIEELESWFFGDVDALAAAYRGIPHTLARKAKYRVPDAIQDCWETLEKVLQEYAHHRGGLQKIRAAKEISLHMNPLLNRSKSFRVFYDGLQAIVGQ